MVDFLKRYWTALGLLAALALFAILKLYSLNFVMGDEHMYNYMSLMVTVGKWPYRDFFFSHPPGQIYLMATFYKIFGYSLPLSKIVPSVAAMISGIFVYLIGSRLMGKKEALLGCILFLFTFDVIRGSSHFTAANVALAFLLSGSYQVIVKRPILGGVLFAMGTFTGLYVLPMALMLVVLVAFRSQRESLKLLLSLAGVLGAFCLIFWLIAGPDFWYQVVTYNLHKSPMKYSWFVKFRDVFFLNTPVMIGFLPAIAWAIVMWSAEGRSDRNLAKDKHSQETWRQFVSWANLWNGDGIAAIILCSLFASGYFFFYSTRTDYYSYYFMLIMPWMGLLTAYMIVDPVRFIWNHFVPSKCEDEPQEKISRQERRRRDRAARKKAKLENQSIPKMRSLTSLWPLIVPIVVLICVLTYRQDIAEERLTKYNDTVKHYKWRDSPYLGSFLNGAIRKLFWDPVRDRRKPPTALARYLQHETNYAYTIDQFVEKVRDICKPGTRIFGEYSLGPFAAAVSDCVLATNLADTNPNRWNSGESKTEDWVEDLEADNLEIAIIRRRSSILKTKAMKDYLYNTFPQVIYKWRDPYIGYVELRRRIQGDM